ncbi:hypothetical protein [Saliniradius amylolyticus]|nr:hypothetical protein [Saliniradius amylolyticus]
MLQALRLLEFLSQEAIQAMIEQEHQRVFDETVSERRARNRKLAEIKATSPDKYFDIPAIERKP